MNELARIYHEKGNYEKAEQLYKRVLEIYEKVLGKDHSDIALTLSELSATCYSLSKYKDVENIYWRMLAIQEKAGEHQRVALTWQKLAYLYQKTGKCKEAEIFYQRALSFQEKELEFSHLDTVKAIEGYASLLRELGRDEEAIALEERIKTI